MNWQHLSAFFWLRWRLFVNQVARAGLVNAVILLVLAVGVILLALGTFAGGLLIGLFAMPEAEPTVHMFVWDGIALAFLFCWTAGVLAELQRSESLALEKFLHLPVSLWGAFLLNYLSSLFSVTLVLLLPVMLGLILGTVISIGLSMLLDLLLLGGFLLMVTAVTYQFQGWLATLMVDKRRRRNVIVLATIFFVGFAQLPNLVNIYYWGDRKQDSVFKKLDKQTEAQNKEMLEHADKVVSLVNMAAPPGWLALGAKAAARGELLIAALCLGGMTLLGVASLRRAYRTTLRLYTGQFGAKPQATLATNRAAASGPARPARNWIDLDVPWVTEPVAGIALAALRSFLRAPEVKIMLLSPILMLVIFGGIFMRTSGAVEPGMRPLLMYGGLCMVMLFLMNLLNNQFGFDRGGFRILVLSPVNRASIMLGKNLAVAPFGVVLGVIVIGCMQAFFPVPLDHFLSLPAQAVSMYLIYCMLANVVSILAPIRMAPGTMKATNVRLTNVLIHLLFFFMFPLAMSPTLLPLALENALGLEQVPVCLILSIAECVGVVYLYRWVLYWEGRFLQMRELAILEAVTTKAE